MKRMLLALLISMNVMASDLLIKGCSDLLSNTNSGEAAITMGYILGVKDTASMTMEQMGLPVVTGVNISQVCRQFLLNMRKQDIQKYPSELVLNITTKGFLINNNGYDWEKVRELVNSAKKCFRKSAELSGKKKY